MMDAMGRQPAPFPPTLGSVFTASAARAAGVASRRLGQPDIIRIARGVYARAPTLWHDAAHPSPSRRGWPGQSGERGLHDLHEHELWRREIVDRARALAPLLGAGEYFSHHTAAALWGLPVRPPGRARRRQVDVARTRGPGVGSTLPLCFREIAARQVSVTQRDGIPLTDPATTWAQLAPSLSLYDAVALGDAVGWRPRFPGTSRLKRPALASHEELSRAAHLPQRRGGQALREMLPLLSTQSASPPETHLRLRLAEWGAPRPSLDHDVATHAGRLLGCSELAFPELLIALEYEGGHHFTQARQFARDIEKYQHYAEHGWLVVRVTSELLYRQQEELRRRIFAALALRGWRG